MGAKFLELTKLEGNETYRIECLHGILDQPAKLTGDNGVIALQSDGSMFFRQEGEIYPFRIEDKGQDARVRDFLSRGFVDLAVPKPMQRSGPFDIFLYVVFFAGKNYKDELRLIFSNNALKTLQEMRVRLDYRDIERSLGRFLDDSFYLQDGNDPDKMLVAYADSSEWVRSAYDEEQDWLQKQKGKEAEKTEQNPADQPPKKQGREIKLPDVPALRKKPRQTIELYGRDVILQVGLYLNEKGDPLAVVQRVIGGRRRNRPCLILGDVHLSATTELAYSSEAVRISLQNDDNTYVNLWRLYAQKEGDFLLRRIRQVGTIGYKDCRVAMIDKSSQLVVTIEPGSRRSLRLLQKGDRLRTVQILPAYMSNENMGWEGYLDYTMSQHAASGEKKNPDSYEITEIRDSSLTMKPISPNKKMSLSGHLILDDTGDKKQIVRRQEAHNRIENGQAANPHLGYIIGGSKDSFAADAGVLPQGWKTSKHIAALSNAVSKKIFRYPPTQTQREAIDIALNTPDIAIIQGPPGTGKTTVITAILERLNELSDKREIKRGQVLVTSLQHDAVRNVIERVSINSLPTVKFGRRASDEEDMETVVARWCEDLAERLREKNPQLKDTQAVDELADAFSIYECSPTQQNAYTYLTKALTLELSDADLLADLQEKRNALKKAIEPEGVSELVKNIQRLRIQKGSFADGGADAADTVLEQVEGLLNPENPQDKTILDTLTEAADCFDRDPEPALLKQLAECKRNLLRRCIPKPRYTKPAIDPEIVSLYQRQMQEFGRYREKADQVLNHLLKALENDPDGIRETLKGYSFAYAATAQQSMGQEIREAKDAMGKGKNPEYDTVIIDEAARVNPGDLMIPLSQARRRIIMVGDHRQLPHMYDEEIFAELDQEGNDVSIEDIRESMFEHMLNRAKALTKRDHIPRFVTLDNQFRMHPDLGNFVSENFYARYGEGFHSPLDGSLFPQPFEREPMKWVDIPQSAGAMETVSYSKCRTCEIEYIVEAIRRYKEMMPEEPLSIGVISFYRAQVNRIRAKLKEEGLLDNVNVGTVDAFQGREFDVIFLSVVRTGRELSVSELAAFEQDPETIEDAQARDDFLRRKDRAGRKQYGFLTSENRLCVALSRQKRLLVVVGDGTLFHGSPGGRMADIFVPALKNFYELCEARGMVEHA